MRVFLSHSSNDKHIVDEVAKRLGRALVVYDRYSFKTGVDLLDSIEKGLNESSLFVLFASRDSLESLWVDREIERAHELHIRRHIKSFIVFVVEEGLELDQIPLWLRSALVKRTTSPKAVCSTIQARLTEVQSERQRRFFVGRSEEADEFEEKMAPIGSPEPAFFLIQGLDGIGRRTLCRRKGSDLFGFDDIEVFDIEDGDSVNDICLKLKSYLQPFRDNEEIEGYISYLETLDSSSALNNASILINDIIDLQILPCLLDRGGFYDNDGHFSNSMSELIRLNQPGGAVKIGLIARRTPPRDAVIALNIPVVRVKPISNDEARLLLSRLAKESSIDLSKETLISLSDFIRGYPPAAYYCMQLVRAYGPDLASRKAGDIVNFNVSVFSQFFESDQNLTDDHRSVLALLSLYGHLPLEIIGRYCGLNSERLSEILSYLMDSSFVLPFRRFYGLSEPLIDVVFRSLRSNPINHSHLLDVVEDYLRDSDDDDHRLELSRLVFRASALANREAPPSAIMLVSDIISIAKDAYHSRDYSNTISWAQKAIEARPLNIDVRTFLARAYVQVEQYDEAEIEIRRIRELGSLRDAYFLTGFLERNRQRYGIAVQSYRKAIEHGRRGVGVHRELAQCYVELNDLDNASKHIATAHERDPDNRYVIDLEVQIATRRGDKDLADRRLRDLKLVDGNAFYLHRKSTVDYRFARYEDALDAAIAACSELPKPPFSFLTQRVKCLIERGRLDEAASFLGELDHNFRGRYADIRTGLRMKLENSRGNHEDALSLFANLREKNLPVHQSLLLQTLDGLERRNALSLPQVADLQKLRANLVNIDAPPLDFFLGHIDDRDVAHF